MSRQSVSTIGCLNSRNRLSTAVAAFPLCCFQNVAGPPLDGACWGALKLSSTDWGTREVASFDSGVTKSRARRMRRRANMVLISVMVASAGIGIVVSTLGFFPQ